MSIRRTRKQKQKAIHRFKLSWSNEAEKRPSEANVKGHFKNGLKLEKKEVDGSENAVTSAKEAITTSLKRDIARSLILASLILGLELVLYLAWH